MKEAKRILKKKLKSSSGETIAEVLVALVISALALIMLAGAIGTSSDLIAKSRNKEGQYYAANAVLDQKGSGGTAAAFTISDTTSGSDVLSSQTQGVSYYENSTYSRKPVIAYKKAETSP